MERARYMAESLRRIGAAIEACARPADDDTPVGQTNWRRGAYVARLARIVRDDAMVAAAVHDLRQEMRLEEERFASAERELSAGAVDAVRKLIRLLDGDDRAEIERLLEPAVKAIVEPLQAGNAIDLRVREVREFTRHWPGVSTMFKVAASVSEETCAAIEGVAMIGRRAFELARLEDVLRHTSIGRLADRLCAGADSWDAALEGGNARPYSDYIGIEQDLSYFIDSVAAKLDEGRSRMLSLHRLRVLFEHFDCVRIRQSLAESKAQRERLLQEEMDRFLFHEGFFPVTHSSVSRGNLDTLVLEAVDGYGLPPLLVELKQVTAFDDGGVSRAAVQRAIEGGRGEVACYRNHVSTRPQWVDVLPVIVVVHTCEEDVSDLEAEDVVLIDLSAVTPSRKRRAVRGSSARRRND